MAQIDEVLVLHHTHADIGYTHPQSVWWELSRRFLDEAINLCEHTADWPEPARVRWTCEVTAPLLDWLEHAPSRQIDRFRSLCLCGQMSVGAMFAHVTPLYDADELARSLQPITRLRRDFGLPVTAALQHDVNGFPWTAHPLLRQSGVRLVVTAINRYFGGVAFPRPSLVRWLGPDGAELLALSGDIYHSFSRILQPEHGDLARMQSGLDNYLKWLTARGYPHSFVYLTATHLDFSDNNPPSPLMADAVRRWNAEGRTPRIRFVSSDELATRMAAVPRTTLPCYTGDWSEWWAYGLGSCPREVAQAQHAKQTLRTAALMRAAHSATRPEPDIVRRAWQAALLFDEHTFGSANTVYQPAAVETRMQRVAKESLAVEAASLAALNLRDELEAYAGNPVQGAGVTGILVVNPSPLPRCETLVVPADWLEGRWTHISSKVHQLDWRLSGPRIGPVSVGPYACLWLPRTDWTSAAPACDEPLRAGVITSPFYRVTFNPTSGRILAVTDLRSGQELLDAEPAWGAFELVQEVLDVPSEECSPHFKGRERLFAIDYDRVYRDEPAWRTDWPAARQSPSLSQITVRHEPDGIVLERHYTAGCGVRDLVIEIRLLTTRPALELNVRFYKDDIRTPEGLYLALPLAHRHWQAHWNAGGLPVALETGQLPDACHEFVFAGQWVAVHDHRGCVVLATPDMPMVQIGGFNFARGNTPIDRANPCLLLAWLMNNYWDTNFNVSQPGEQSFRYVLTTQDTYDPTAATTFAQTAAAPLLVHPVVGTCTQRMAPLVGVTGAILLSIQPAPQAGTLLLRLANPNPTPSAVTLHLPGLTHASLCDPLGNITGPLPVADDTAECQAPAQSLLFVSVQISASVP